MRGYRKLHINKICLAMGMHFSDYFFKGIACLNPKGLAQVVKALVLVVTPLGLRFKYL